MIIDPVTYEDVRKACCALLGDGEGPSRPKVQDVLVKQIGRKGSNSVVQGFINQFWAEAAERMNKPTRQVADIPEQFVPIVDRALLEMVAVSRQMAAKEFTEREDQLAGQTKEWQAAVQLANDTAASAEQLRLRAEGELNGLQSIVSDLRGSVRSLEDRLAEEARKVESGQQTIAAKDLELARQFAALETSASKLEQANEIHRQEVNRLLKQVDDERQSAKRESQSITKQVEATRSELELARRDLSTQREETVRLQAELGAKNTINATQVMTIEDQKSKLGAAEAELKTVQHELTALRVRYETAEGQRQAIEKTCTSQAEELGELRQLVSSLDAENRNLRDVATTKVKSNT